MHILIATAGALPAARVAALVESIAPSGSPVSVMTVIDAPESLLDDLEDTDWRPFDDEGDAHPAREEAARRYVAERGARLVEPVVAALRTRGITATTVIEDGNDPAATIVRVAEEQTTDIIIMGATRPLFDEAVWSSVSVKVMQQSPIPLLLVPGVARTLDDVERAERRTVIDGQTA